MKRELIPDNRFESGFRVLSQKDHADGDRIRELGRFCYGQVPEEPRWLLAQWDSGPCLWENRKDTGNPYELTDGKWRHLRLDPDENILSFRMDTAAYYKGKGARYGDYWPHLLIEQRTLGYESAPEEEKRFFSCGADKLTVSFDLRLTGYQSTPHPDDWVEAAQFLMYFYIKGTQNRDFVWFGLHLFDSREQPEGKLGGLYVGYDGGKEDASGEMIYNVGSEDLYADCAIVQGDWVHVELDLKPHMERLFAHGQAEGYLRSSELRELVINGMNVGWETIGTFDHTMEMKNLSLISEIV